MSEQIKGILFQRKVFQRPVLILITYVIGLIGFLELFKWFCSIHYISLNQGTILHCHSTDMTGLWMSVASELT